MRPLDKVQAKPENVTWKFQTPKGEARSDTPPVESVWPTRWYGIVLAFHVLRRASGNA